jgi:hypothetical protein
MYAITQKFTVSPARFLDHCKELKLENPKCIANEFHVASTSKKGQVNAHFLEKIQQ